MLLKIVRSTYKRIRRYAFGTNDILVLLKAVQAIGSEALKGSKPKLLKIDRSNICNTKAKLENGPSPARLYMDVALGHCIEKYCPSNNANVLEVGCGRGHYYLELAKKQIIGSYTGIDLALRPDTELMQGKSNGLFIRFLQLSAEKVNTLNEIFNFSFSLSTLHYIQDDIQALKSIHQVMTPEGYSVHCVPSLWSHFLYIHQGVRRYSARSIRETFSNARFQVVEIRKLGGVFSFLLHWLWISFMESKLQIKAMRRQPRLLNIYGKILKLCTKLDPFAPWMEAGYLVVAKKL